MWPYAGRGSFKTATPSSHPDVPRSLGDLVTFRTHSLEAQAVLKITFITSNTLTHGQEDTFDTMLLLAVVIVLLC